VTAFGELTERGQRLRLRALALDALGAYDLEVARCAYVARAFNTVFRVDATSGAKYALRVSPELRIHADDCELVEAAWTRALRIEAGVATPRAVQASDSAVVVQATREGVPGARTCVLFEWVSGRRLRERMSVDGVHATGAIAAVTHEHGARYTTRQPTGALVADRVLYFRLPNRLADLGSSYGTALDEGLVRAQQALDDLWRHPPHAAHLLHGDVQPGNVMISRGRVTLIDFQDLIWGFEIQDLMTTLLALGPFEDRDALRAAFRAGYETVRPWPESDPAVVAALAAARHLNVVNYCLNMGRADLHDLMARHAEPVVEWMESSAG
jgi:Ser/Thr protein kinase RdoA (MazF antagonist)